MQVNTAINYTASVHQTHEAVSISLYHAEGVLTDVHIAGDEVSFSSSDSDGTTCNMRGKSLELASKVRDTLGAIKDVGALQHLVYQVQLGLLIMGPKPKNRPALVMH